MYWTTICSLVLSAIIAAALVVPFLLFVRRKDQRRLAELASRNRRLRHTNAELSRARDALRSREEWYRNLFHSSKDMVLVYGITPDGLPGPLLEVNNLICEKLEHTRERLLSMTVLDLEAGHAPYAKALYTGTELLTLSEAEIAERDKLFAGRDTQALVRQILNERIVQYERVLMSKSGRHIPVEITAHRIDHANGPLIVCTAHDITERRRTEEALHESEQRFRDVFSTSPIGVAIYDAGQKMISVNPACLKMFGAPSSEEFARFNMFDNPILPSAARHAFHRRETVRFEFVVDFGDVLRQGLFVTRRTGQAHFDMLINNLGLDREFNPRGFLVQVQDITKRRLAESALRQSERQLRQAQKMEAIGTLAGGIAHDFNNILTPIIGYTEMARDQAGGGVELSEYLDEIYHAGHRAKALVNQILTFSRQAESDGRPTHLIPIIKEVTKLQRSRLPPSITVDLAIKTCQDMVVADPTQIHQVLMNLCANALHAMRDQGGLLEIRLTDFVLGPRSRSEFPQLAPGRYVRLSVRDSGVGMEKATVERIFEPFFTTKASGEGTGMGLAVVHGIITSLKGAIQVESAIGSGSTFHVVLPTVEAEPESSAETLTALPKGNETVLFVDDEPVILKLVSRMLVSLGYQPLVTSRSTEALQMIRQDPKQVDLLITDQVMPDLTGCELAQEILAIRPGLPIVLCTGFSDTVSPEDAAALGIHDVMLKPIALRELAETVRRALGRSGAALAAEGAP